MQYRFVTIRISHYCEKARWALDRGGVDYVEDGYMPAMHFPAVMRALAGTGAGETGKASTRYSTPVLVGEGGARWTHSREIARFACPDLFASADAEALADHFDDELGPHSRRMVYWFMLGEPARLVQLAQDNVSARQARVFRLMLPAAVPMLRRALSVTASGYERSSTKVAAIADDVAERLADGRPYLMGEDFTIADLTFAALFAPVVLPPEYDAELGEVEGLPGELQAIVQHYRATPAGQFALRMFADHRA